MNREDYPALYRAADASAVLSERVNARRQIIYLALLLSAAAAGSFGGLPPAPGPRLLFLASTLFLVAGLALLWVDLVQNRERVWHRSRSVAESVKSLSWRYMMRAAPLGAGLEEESADRALLDRLAQVRRQSAADEPVIADPSLAGASEITQAMRQRRADTLDERIACYRDERLIEQREWYIQQAISNRRAALRLSALVSLLHVAALATAILHVANHPSAGAFVPVLAAAAASVLAWSNSRRFTENRNAYSQAANDLASLLAEVDHVTDDAGLDRFVQDTEAAVSREHTLWCVRRNTPPSASPSSGPVPPAAP